MLTFLKIGVAISSRKFIAVTFLTSGTLAWFFLINIYHGTLLKTINPAGTWIITGQILFYVCAIISGIIASLLNKKNFLRKFLVSWVILGILTTVGPLYFQGIWVLIVFNILLGISLGLGLPASLALIANCTNIEERGRVAGAIILETFVIAMSVAAIINILGEGVLAIILLMVVVRSISLFALLLEKCDIDIIKKKSELMRRSNYREFIFYIIPWIIFTFAAGLASNIVPKTDPYQSVESLGTIIRYGLIAIFGFIWGIVADRLGRKWPIYIGLIILGGSFALIGFALSANTYFIYLLLTGVAWGSFLTVYIVIPGDLSNIASREKYYALGTISPLIALFALIVVGDMVPLFSASAFTQVLSLLLFLSIIPILRAKETLQESKIRSRKMKEYTEKVGKIVKESKK